MDWSTPGRYVMLFLTVYLVLMVSIPLLYPYGSFTELDGRAGVIENWHRQSFADPLTRVVYLIGDLFCHQETSRSFIINGSQMAFCQRDVSILAGVISGLVFTDKNIGILYIGNKKYIIIGISMILLTIIEWAFEYISGVDIPAARIFTGVMAGVGIAIIFQYAVIKQYEKINDTYS